MHYLEVKGKNDSGMKEKDKESGKLMKSELSS
jgi:hypothetical protein